MQIKEAETIVEITKANIRYYEEQGLIHPTRNPINGYREYTEENIQTLQNIKLLRMIGLTLTDIKEILLAECSLENKLAERTNALQKEIGALTGYLELCHLITEKGWEIADLNKLSSDSLQQYMEDYRSQLERLKKYDKIKSRKLKIDVILIFILTIIVLTPLSISWCLQYWSQAAYPWIGAVIVFLVLMLIIRTIYISVRR